MKKRTAPAFVVTALVLACALSTQLHAQDPSEVLEEVKVIGERIEGGTRGRNQAASRQDLENSDYTDMESFFDEIDGLSTLGGDNQGNAFSINGMSAGLSNVTLDGQGLGEGRGSGGFGVGDISPDMVRRVQLYLTPSASMEEGGAAGTVNLQLRNPLEIPAQGFSARGRLGLTPDDGSLSPSANFFAGGPLPNRVFGYMVNATAAQRENVYGRQDVSQWVQGDMDGEPVYLPSQVRNSDVRDRQRNGFAGLTIGYQPAPSLLVGARLYLSRKHRANRTQALQHRFEQQRTLDILEIDDRIVTQVESSDRSRENLRVVGSTREEQIDSVLAGLDIRWRNGPWRLEAAVGQNTDDSHFPTPSQSATFTANSEFGYRLQGDGGLAVYYPQGFPDSTLFDADRVNLNDRRTDNTHRFINADATRQLEGELLRRWRFGVAARETLRDRRSESARVSFDGDDTLATYDGGLYRTPWDPAPWPGVAMGVVDDRVGAADIDWRENLLNRDDMQRRTNAGYIQADFRRRFEDNRFLAGNAGLRVVDTRTRIEGFQDSGEGLVPVSIRNDYTDLLPSITVRIRVAGRTSVTLAAARVMSQPSFNDLAPGIRLNQSDKTGRSGNPELEPFRAGQLVAGMTWSPDRSRRLKASLTYRDVESYFAYGEAPLELDDFYIVTRPVNGESATVLTTNLSFEQGLRLLHRRLKDVTVGISYTNNRSKTDMSDPFTGERLPLPDLAARVARFQLAYAADRFSGKLTYQWQGESLKASVTQSGFSAWNRPVGRLDLGMGWALADGIRLGIDFRNLTGDGPVRTTDFERQIWRITERDPTVAATLQAKW